MTDLIVAVALLAVLGGAGYYVYRAKKSGTKCIGCPLGGKCPGVCSCCTEHKDGE